MPASTPKNCPFVVLHHVGYGESHFDLMIDLDGVGPLATWRCPSWPVTAGDAFIPMSGHRRAYLTYEGAVSGGRGHVARIAQGFCSLMFVDDSMLKVQIAGVDFFLIKTFD